MRKYHRELSKVITHIILISVSVVILFPIYWMISTSFKNQTEIFRYPPYWVPPFLRWENYFTVFRGQYILRYMFNSLIVSITAVVIIIFIAALAGYAFSRYRSKTSNFFLVLVLGFTLVPPFINIIPLYVIMMKLRLINTYLALVIIYVAWLAPLNTWIMKSFFDSIPASVEEASLTDGCTRFQSLWRIVLPIAKPGLVAVIAISFVMVWGEFIVALVFTSSDTMRTVSVGAYNYLGYFEKSFGPLCAFSTIIILPVLVLFLSIRKQFMKGMIEGAMK